MKIGIIGTGVFGASLALALASNQKNEIVMWSENAELVKEYKKTAKIPTLFQDKMFPKSIKITNSYEEALKDAKLVLLVTSVLYLESVCKEISSLLSSDIPVTIGTKGIAEDSHLFVHEIAKKSLKNPISILGGPTFALDVANLEPVGLNVASKNKKCIKATLEAFQGTSVFVEPSHDLVGTALCGCVKNIYAIGSGIVSGLGYKESTHFFYLTAVYKELETILFHFNSTLTTLHSLSGFGDLVLTCSSSKSRNYTFGEMVGRGSNQQNKEKYLKNNTVEGVHTLKALLPILEKKHIKVPILKTISKIVLEQEKPKSLIEVVTKKGN